MTTAKTQVDYPGLPTLWIIPYMNEAICRRSSERCLQILHTHTRPTVIGFRLTECLRLRLRLYVLS